MMQINEGNILIRSAIDTDAKILTSWWNDGNVMAHAGFPNGLNTTVEEVSIIIKKNQNSLSQTCMIEVDSKSVGECNYRLNNCFAEIGIKICDTNYQNKGLGSKVLQMLISFIFTDKAINKSSKIEKIILDTNVKNLRAQHVYEKLGFKKVRTNVDSWKNQLGELQTSIDYELTFEEYLSKTEIKTRYKQYKSLIT